MSFKGAERLKVHQKKHREGKVVRVRKPKGQVVEEKLHSCSYCSRSFKRASYLREHIKTHTKEKPYSCPVCGKSFAQASGVPMHMKVHTRAGGQGNTDVKPPVNVHSCSACNKSFSSPAYLEEHIRIHNKTRPYSCSDCGKSFTTAFYVKKHMEIHTRDKLARIAEH
jgi:KRAB domain-containing zinc finger protein